eukprot:PhM_4_TR2110/c2_g1_i2/m.57469
MKTRGDEVPGLACDRIGDGHNVAGLHTTQRRDSLKVVALDVRHRLPPGQHLHQRAPDRPDVALGVVRLLLSNLRRHEAQRALHLSLLVVGVDAARRAEVSQLQLAVRQHQVRALDVAVHDAVLVQERNGAHELAHVRSRLRGRKRLALHDAVHGAAVGVLHEHVDAPVAALAVQVVDDVLVLERAQQRNLVNKVRHLLLGVAVLRAQLDHLHGHDAAGREVARLVHVAERAAAELLDALPTARVVLREDGPDLRNVCLALAFLHNDLRGLGQHGAHVRGADGAHQHLVAQRAVLVALVLAEVAVHHDAHGDVLVAEGVQRGVVRRQVGRVQEHDVRVVRLEDLREVGEVVGDGQGVPPLPQHLCDRGAVHQVSLYKDGVEADVACGANAL